MSWAGGSSGQDTDCIGSPLPVYPHALHSCKLLDDAVLVQPAEIPRYSPNTLTGAMLVKRSFALIVFQGSSDTVTESGHMTGSGAAQGANWAARVTALKSTAEQTRLTVYSQSILEGRGGDDSSACCDVVSMTDVVWPIESIPANSVLIIAGSPEPETLREACQTLLSRGHDIVVVVDALENLPALLPVLAELNEKSVQMMAAGSIKALVTAQRLMMYRFPKADDTTTIAVLADVDTDDPLVLTMVRDRAPYQGMESLPGGFLNVQLESLPECAAREVMEECFVNKSCEGDDDEFTYHVSADDLELIDVRSRPDRDERGHVVDHGYAWFVPSAEQDKVMSAISAGDDAREGSARFVRSSELLDREIAFDHRDLLVATLAKLKARKS